MLLLFAFLVFLFIWAVCWCFALYRVGDLHGILLIVLIESQVVEHGIDASHHVLDVIGVLSLVCEVGGISLLLPGLHAASAGRHILVILLACQSLQGLVQIFELLVLLLSHGRVVLISPVVIPYLLLAARWGHVRMARFKVLRVCLDVVFVGLALHLLMLVVRVELLWIIHLIEQMCGPWQLAAHHFCCCLGVGRVHFTGINQLFSLMPTVLCEIAGATEVVCIDFVLERAHRSSRVVLLLSDVAVPAGVLILGGVLPRWLHSLNLRLRHHDVMLILVYLRQEA